ncbi:MAG: hypothetical protein LBR79_06965 [Oscillospiraceae bacterium]|nr:hypothetical protein [Oscillospiraceae bacterium]
MTHNHYLRFFPPPTRGWENKNIAVLKGFYYTLLAAGCSKNNIYIFAIR